jgi:hypothetical protein
MRLWNITVEISEDASAGYPIVVHEFLGKTREEAEGYLEAHQGSDSFLRDCLHKGRWHDVSCRAKVTYNGWIEYSPKRSAVGNPEISPWWYAAAAVGLLALTTDQSSGGSLLSPARYAR